MKLNNAIIRTVLLCICLTSPILIFSQSFDLKKEKIRNLNKASRLNATPPNINFKCDETEAKYLMENDSSEATGKYLGQIDGTPMYIYPLSDVAAITTNTLSLNNGELGYDLQGEGLTLILNDIGSPRSDHVLFQSSDSSSSIENNNQPIYFHPTHMASIICGNDSMGAAFKGMAPKAKIELSVNYGRDQYSESLVSNHSVIRSGETYNYNYDAITYNNPYHTEVTASGNTGNRAYTLMNNTKNEITVGNIDDLLDYNSPKDVIISHTSGAGPTLDGRIKPDIVANGIGVLGAANYSTTSVANGAGTSQACANASGSLLLVQEYYDQQYETYMRSSTLKALSIHTAREAGSYPGPDYFFGYGVLNTLEMVQLIENDTLQNNIRELEITDGESVSIDIYPNYTEPLIVTMAWTDPGGGQIIFPVNGGGGIDTSLRALVNDLDIKILSEGMEHLPYTLNRMNPCNQNVRANNSFDNLEQIEIPRPVNSDHPYTIEISHKGTLKNTTQNFSLIISGTSEVQNDTIKRAIEIYEDADATWSTDKITLGDLKVKGKLTIEASVKADGSKKSISVLENGELALNNANLTDVDIFMFPHSKLTLNGLSSLNRSNIYFLDTVAITSSNAGSLEIVTDSTYIYDYMDNVDLTDIVSIPSTLIEASFPGIIAERICLYGDQMNDTIYQFQAMEVVLGNPTDDYAEEISIHAHVEINANSPLINNQDLRISTGKSLRYKIIPSLYTNPIIVPEIGLAPIVHKYYNGNNFKTNTCQYVPLIVN